MDIIHALTLGVVEGVTEFLPVSSTGHLILASALLNIPSSEFLKTFEIVIQLGAILAVVILYWRKLQNLSLLKQLAVAFIPTAAIGLALYPVIKKYFLDNTLLVTATLFIGGILLLLFERWYASRAATPIEPGEAVEHVGYQKAFAIGLFQSIAMIPGVSRSGATIVGGLALGIPRTTIVEFSFLLAIPTMLAATGLDLLKNYNEIAIGGNGGLLLAGLGTSFVTALVVVKWFLAYVQKHSFTSFGIYRIAVAIVCWLVLL